MKDVIIVGAGPAGISTSLYTVRAGLETVVFNHNETSLSNSKIENYYGFAEEIDGDELFENAIKGAKRLGVDVINKEVVAIEQEEDSFLIKTSDSEYRSKSLVLAIGNKKRKPRIKNLEKFEGSGISYCAVCDGFFFKNKKVGVLGSGSFAMHEAEYLSRIADVIIFTNGEELSSDYKTYSSKVIEFVGDDNLRAVSLENGEEIELDAMFIALGSAGAEDFAKQLALFTEKSYLLVDEEQKTNVPGIFAAGDCCPGLAQVAKAVGEGAIAGMSVIKYLRSKKQ